MSRSLRIVLFCVLLSMAASATSADQDRVVEPLMPGLDGLSQPVILESSLITPDYPAAGLESAGDVTVVVRMVVERDGSVSRVAALISDRPGQGFEDSAVHAVSRWRYEPARLDGGAVPVYHLVKVRFREPENREQLLMAGRNEPQRTFAAWDSAGPPIREPWPTSTDTWNAGTGFGASRVPGLGSAAGLVAGMASRMSSAIGTAASPQPVSKMRIPSPCSGYQPCLQTRPAGSTEVRRGGGGGRSGVTPDPKR